MRTKKIDRNRFDFDAFIEAETAFIERKFLLDIPAAGDTMRYFYDFSNESNKAAEDKDFSNWQMEDFKNAILQGGETIFFPFSSGPDLYGTIDLASRKTIRLTRNDEDAQSLGLTDCVGILVNLERDMFVFKSSIAWGDMTHSIEEFPRMQTDREMNRFLKSFTKKS